DGLGWERFLEPCHAIPGKAIGPLEGSFDIVTPGNAGIDHQLRAISEALAGGADEGFIEFGIAGAKRTPAEFGRSEAALAEGSGNVECLLRIIAEEHGCVGKLGMSLPAAEQLKHRPSQLLPNDVPQRDIGPAVGVMNLLNIQALADSPGMQPADIIRQINLLSQKRLTNVDDVAMRHRAAVNRQGNQRRSIALPP